eukprot:764326-Hanusia_phi.AAC.2
MTTAEIIANCEMLSLAEHAQGGSSRGSHLISGGVREGGGLGCHLRGNQAIRSFTDRLGTCVLYV